MKKDTFVMSARQASELDYALERNGWTPADVKALSQGDMLARILPVLLGRSEIKPREHIIDCDVPVFVPDGWEVLPPAEQIPSRAVGKIVWDPTAARLHLSLNQKGSNHIKGNNLRLELAEGKHQVYTAHVLDYLLKPENQYLIPEEWKGKSVFFWGTIYRRSERDFYVRYLYWGGDRWGWYSHDYWLGSVFAGSNPAVVRAS